MTVRIQLIGLGLAFAWGGICAPANARESDPISDAADAFVWIGGTTFPTIRQIPLDRSDALLAGGAYASSGWAISAQVASSRERFPLAYETLISYSYKLPIFDVSIGASACETQQSNSECGSGMRMGLSTNNSTRTRFHVNADYAGSGRTIFETGLTSRLFRHGSASVNGVLNFVISNWRESNDNSATACLMVSAPWTSETKLTGGLGYYKHSYSTHPSHGRVEGIYANFAFSFYVM